MCCQCLFLLVKCYYFIHASKLSSCAYFAPSRSFPFCAAIKPSWRCYRCIMISCVISLHHFKSCMASFFIRVDVTSKAVYELVVEPIPEPQAVEPQAEAAVEPDPEVANPADWQGKPRCITLNFSIQ